MKLFTNRKPRKFSIALAALCTGLASISAWAEFSPASFDVDEEKRSFADLLEFPDISGNVSIMMMCASQIATSGKMSETGCMIRNNGEVVFGRAVQAAAKKARVTPAEINGKEYKVYLQFRVEFIKEGD
jgi:hypothetical protein